MTKPAYFSGHYEFDCAERAMIHKIIAILRLPGGNIPANYHTAYSFIEDDWGGIIWDQYYGLFKSLHPKFIGPFDKRAYNRFKKSVIQYFAHWQNGELYRGLKPSE
ncbi:MAG: hypothetical protein N2235_01415 [Fischerella sp.]|nr:hypothetical protein [Fischerella sp.]